MTRHFIVFNIFILLFIIISPIANANIVSNKYLSRADAVKLLLSASRESIPNIENDISNYPDVIGTNEETKYIKYAVKLKMLDPEPLRGLLFPYRSVSRAEFLKMMSIAYHFPPNIPYSYTDIPSDAWFKPYVGLADYYNLFEDAKEKGELKPNMRITKKIAQHAILRLFLKEPYRKPKNFSFTSGEKTLSPSRVVATPKLVKETIIRLFSKQGIEPPKKTRQEMIDIINSERSKKNLPLLKDNLLLRIAAQKHAEDMYKRGYFSHTTPEGLDYVDRIKNANYLYIDQSKCGCKSVINIRALMENNRQKTNPGNIVVKTKVCGCKPHFALGENIAKGQLTSKEVMEDWMNSPPHRANILHPQFDEIGIGIFGNIWVQNFGRKRIE